VFRFATPLWLLVLIIPFSKIFLYFYTKGRTEATLFFSDVSVFKRIGTGMGEVKRTISLVLAAFAVILLILAMARPQSGQHFHTRSTYGIDIILTLDISSSMGAMDFHPLTRFEAAAEVVKDFISKRTSDRIGLVVFAAQSFTMCPLTLDYNILSSFLDKAWGSRVDDGTAIGLAIATSLNRLRDSEAKSKVIIVLTDGMNNCGNLDPLTAAKMAQTLGIRIYTIGVGSEGRAPMIIDGKTVWTETHIDEASLQEVAKITGGKYYRAKNTLELKGIYQEIGKLETSKINYNEWVQYNEKYNVFLKIGFIALLMSFILDKTLLRRLP
jgi:Ca-activated chloride channel family protein